jgi:hypothetical protein
LIVAEDLGLGGNIVVVSDIFTGGMESSSCCGA